MGRFCNPVTGHVRGANLSCVLFRSAILVLFRGRHHISIHVQSRSVVLRLAQLLRKAAPGTLERSQGVKVSVRLIVSASQKQMLCALSILSFQSQLVDGDRVSSPFKFVSPLHNLTELMWLLDML